MVVVHRALHIPDPGYTASLYRSFAHPTRSVRDPKCVRDCVQGADMRISILIIYIYITCMLLIKKIKFSKGHRIVDVGAWQIILGAAKLNLKLHF